MPIESHVARAMSILAGEQNENRRAIARRKFFAAVVGCELYEEKDNWIEMKEMPTGSPIIPSPPVGYTG